MSIDLHRVDGRTMRSVTITSYATEAEFAGFVNVLTTVAMGLSTDVDVQTDDVSTHWLNAWVDSIGSVEWDEPDGDDDDDAPT